MAFSIDEVVEKAEMREADYGSDSNTYKRVFYVKTTDATTDSMPAIMNANLANPLPPWTGCENNRIPQLGNEMCGDDFANLRSKSLKAVSGDREIWAVTCNYDSIREPVNSDPTDNECLFRFGFSQYNKPVEQAYNVDNDGKLPNQPPVITDTRFSPSVAVLASSLVPFNPPHIQEEGNLLMTITCTDNNFDPSDARFYKDTINDRDIAIGGVLIEKFQGRIRNYGGTQNKKPNDAGRYWTIDIEIEIQAKGWVSEFLDLSFYRLDAAKLRIMIRDKNEQEITEPAMLDGAGGLLAVGADPVYLEYYTYFPSDWSAIAVNLPATLPV